MRHLLLSPATTVLGAILGLSACTTVPVAVPTPVVIAPQPVQTCQSVTTLVRQEIPAETKTQTAITLIENPPYEPIESRTTRQVIVKQAQVFYTNANGSEVLDICETNIERGAIGPAAGEILPEI